MQPRHTRLTLLLACLLALTVWVVGEWSYQRASSALDAATAVAAGSVSSAGSAAQPPRPQAAREDIHRMLQLGRLGVHGGTLLALMAFVGFVRQAAARQATAGAHAAALQAERAALGHQVRQRTAELSELNRHLQDVREAERSLLARTLHDELGSLLTAAKLDIARLRRALASGAPGADAEQRLAHLVQTIDEGIAFKRRIIEALSPSALHHLGLRPALEILATELQRRSGLAVVLDVPEIALPAWPRTVAFRLVEACLSNVERHAGVQQAQVLVREEGTDLVVQVRDAGAGFVPAELAGAHRDLASLRYRIEGLGGSLRVTSAPGKGTEVEAHLPLQASSAPGPDDEA